MADGKLLIVDDNQSALSALKLFLQAEFQMVEVLPNPGQIPSMLRKQAFDVVLLDMNFSAGVNTGNEGLFWLSEIKKISPSTEVVMFTAYGDVELAVKALKLGAADFVLKPWENEKLLATLRSALRLQRAGVEVQELRGREAAIRRDTNRESEEIVGSSPAILKVMALIGKVAGTDANVLITGENGTGKDLVAREIHRRSPRAGAFLVRVDMGAIPDTLFESELFGHKKGSFTDAREDRMGKFQLAHKGTLFLDEIGNLPLSLQPKLLSILQNREIVPVGSNQSIPVDIRVLSATNCPLNLLVEQKHFREDLLYRLDILSLFLPPLRQRSHDIVDLLRLFTEQYNRENRERRQLVIEPDAIAELERQEWMGNIRELKNICDRIFVLNSTGVVTRQDVLEALMSGSVDLGRRGPESWTAMTADRGPESPGIPTIDGRKATKEELARMLGISRTTLWRRSREQ